MRQLSLFFLIAAFSSEATLAGPSGNTPAPSNELPMFYDMTPVEGPIGTLVEIRITQPVDPKKTRIYFASPDAKDPKAPGVPAKFRGPVEKDKEGKYVIKTSVPDGAVSGGIKLVLPKKKEILLSHFSVVEKGYQRSDWKPRSRQPKGHGGDSSQPQPEPTPLSTAPVDPTQVEPQYADLDLPMVKPEYLPPVRPDDDDPRDTVPIHIYGETILVEDGKLIIVWDVSGSMWDVGGGSRIAKAKAELSAVISNLPPTFKFDIVRYTNNDAEVLWPHSGGPDEGMREATPGNKAAAIAWVTGVGYGGNTPTYLGVWKALEFLKNHHVLLITDGYPWAWQPIADYWADPRNHPNMVLNPITGEFENMASQNIPGTTDAIDSTVLIDEFLIFIRNHVWRPQHQTTPARIDVLGIEANGGQYAWYCREVARNNGGEFKNVK